MDGGQAPMALDNKAGHLNASLLHDRAFRYQ